MVAAGPCKGVNLFIGPAFLQMANGDYDNYIFQALKTIGFCFERSSCWDVGAHFGYHSFAFASLSGPHGRVLAFEPNPANRERMQLHLERNPNLASQIKLLPYALSDSNGDRKFKLSLQIESGASTCSYLDSGLPPGDRVSYKNFQDTIVQARKADNLLDDQEIHPPDLMKIDVEGAEQEVLLGAEHIIKKHRPVLAMEVHNIHCMFNTQKWLFNQGYELHLVTDAPYSHSRCFVIGCPAIS
jgi:FkbM family methyltransferase